MNEFEIGRCDAATSVQSFKFSIFEQSLLLVVSMWRGESLLGVNERGPTLLIKLDSSWPCENYLPLICCVYLRIGCRWLSMKSKLCVGRSTTLFLSTNKFSIIDWKLMTSALQPLNPKNKTVFVWMGNEKFCSFERIIWASHIVNKRPIRNLKDSLKWLYLNGYCNASTPHFAKHVNIGWPPLPIPTYATIHVSVEIWHFDKKKFSDILKF